MPHETVPLADSEGSKNIRLPSLASGDKGTGCFVTAGSCNAPPPSNAATSTTHATMMAFERCSTNFGAVLALRHITTVNIRKCCQEEPVLHDLHSSLVCLGEGKPIEKGHRTRSLTVYVSQAVSDFLVTLPILHCVHLAWHADGPLQNAHSLFHG